MTEVINTKAKRLKIFFRIISNPNILKLIEHIKNNPGVKQSDAYLHMNVSQSVLSKWVKVLKSYNLVSEERTGIKRRYYVHNDNLKLVNDQIEKIINDNLAPFEIV
jgi:predicted transcriptional regulator